MFMHLFLACMLPVVELRNLALIYCLVKFRSLKISVILSPSGSPPHPLRGVGSLLEASADPVCKCVWIHGFREIAGYNKSLFPMRYRQHDWCTAW